MSLWNRRNGIKGEKVWNRLRVVTMDHNDVVASSTSVLFFFCPIQIIVICEVDVGLWQTHTIARVMVDGTSGLLNVQL